MLYMLFLQYADVLSVFLPFLAFLVAGIGGRRLGAHGAEMAGTVLVLASVFSAFVLFQRVVFFGDDYVVFIANWISFGALHADWALRFDTLSAVMILVVNLISAMVHVYSIGYMEEDPDRPRFFSYLGFFTFAMLMLVTSDNLIQLFFGWEGVGLASYLLIGFWFGKESANNASIKAFLVNRVGDFGFALGIMGIFYCFGSVSFSTILLPSLGNQDMTVLTFFGWQVNALTVSCFLLFMGAMGKSAQLGLHTWLPDAMEGPTPVSALIHAATMVTAGVFMVCRLSPLFEAVPIVLAFVAVIGAVTAFVAATIALTQWDIKRVIAYSTMSQLGYMFMAVGVSAYGAAMFHLMTHAFFKSLLFLGAGAVIHSLHGEQDMRNMGGMRHKLPFTTVLMWIGALALAGMPFFSGYYSKDIILEAVWSSHSALGSFVWSVGVLTALMTAFYGWRLLFLTFHGAPRCDVHAYRQAHEAPLFMLIPLGILALGAVFSGWYCYGWFVGDSREIFWRGLLFPSVGAADLVDVAHDDVPAWVVFAPFVVGIVGIFCAWRGYISLPGWTDRIAARLEPLYRLFSSKWYFDQLYDRYLVQPAIVLGRVFWKFGDGILIDGCGPDGITALTAWASRQLRRSHTGHLYHYAFVMVGALAVLVGVFVIYGFAF